MSLPVLNPRLRSTLDATISSLGLPVAVKTNHQAAIGMDEREDTLLVILNSRAGTEAGYIAGRTRNDVRIWSVETDEGSFQIAKDANSDNRVQHLLSLSEKTDRLTSSSCGIVESQGAGQHLQIYQQEEWREKVDCVLFLDVSTEILKGMICECWDILKPGGKLFFEHVGRSSVEEVENYLKKVGFVGISHIQLCYSSSPESFTAPIETSSRFLCIKANNGQEWRHKEDAIRVYEDGYRLRSSSICIRQKQNNNGKMVYEVLLVQRKVSSKSNHKWSIPGGGLDVEESAEEASFREVREEAGVVVSAPHYIGQFYSPSNKDPQKASKTSAFVFLDAQELPESDWVESLIRRRRWLLLDISTVNKRIKSDLDKQMLHATIEWLRTHENRLHTSS